MLQYLRIKNLALMEEASLELDSGLIGVTGETGAGKSVLLGALALLSGTRGDKMLVRKGADVCEVECALYFSDPEPVNAALKEMGLPPCEEGALLLSRMIHKSKLPRIRVNGQLTTLSNLQAIGELWIDFHGPGEPKLLFRERRQLELLDLYARNDEPLAEYLKAYREWRRIQQKARDLLGQEKLGPDEREFIERQLESIDAAEVSKENIEALERDFNRLSQAEELVELGSALEEGLAGDEGVVGQLGALLRHARELAAIDSDSQGLADRLEALVIEAEDLASGFSEAARGGEFDEEEANGLRERMEAWLEVKRRHGPEVDMVLEKRAALQNKLDTQGDVEGAIEELEQEAAEKEKTLRKMADGLRTNRLRAANELGREAEKLINDLGFKKALFKIEITREDELTDHGDSACRFLFAPNAGQDLLPLNKIASSGELARVMLALKAVLAQVDETPVLVFDEVDANIGGEIAKVVGRELARLGERHQVFCVTHMPQVAASAGAHYVVTKHQDDENTWVRIDPLHDKPEERRVELARMLGDRTSATALQHAGELLTAAKM